MVTYRRPKRLSRLPSRLSAMVNGQSLSLSGNLTICSIRRSTGLPWHCYPWSATIRFGIGSQKSHRLLQTNGSVKRNTNSKRLRIRRGRSRSWPRARPTKSTCKEKKNKTRHPVNGSTKTSRNSPKTSRNKNRLFIHKYDHWHPCFLY